MKFEYDNFSNRFSFPASLTPDLPEAITQGDTIEVALREAAK